MKDKSARKIDFAQFDAAVEQCAAKRGETKEQLEAIILGSGGKTLTGTKAEANKFHDDKSLYTGVHAKGGPDTGHGTGAVTDISQTLDRSEADVRGVKK